jgi:hypothetical protein
VKILFRESIKKLIRKGKRREREKIKKKNILDIHALHAHDAIPYSDGLISEESIRFLSFDNVQCHNTRKKKFNILTDYFFMLHTYFREKTTTSSEERRVKKIAIRE